MAAISFILFLVLFMFIGLLSVLKNKHTSHDYLVASHQVPPWLVALSAVSTNNSGYMFTGMIGYTYVTGLSSIWLMIGWVFGDLVSSFVVHKRLRNISLETKEPSFAGVISNWSGREYKRLKAICGVITLIFLCTYAAAQLKAGSKALHVLFGWDYAVGSMLGATIVLVYCFAGGIRASIWTDAAQSFVMIISMATLCFLSISNIGGLEQLATSVEKISPTYMNLFPDDLPFPGTLGIILFVLSWVCAGYGVTGQPHIMVRFMSLDNTKFFSRVQIYYYSWYLCFFILTIFVGLAARVILTDTASFDSEIALPVLSRSIFPGFFVGVILASLFAATMSTADSQILCCTSSLARDFSLKINSYLITKLVTVIVTAYALVIALYGQDSIFKLVLISWSALASSFTPLITVYCLGGRVTERVAITMVFAGLLGMLCWRHYELHTYIYEVMPGIVFGFVPYFMAKLGNYVKN